MFWGVMSRWIRFSGWPKAPFAAWAWFRASQTLMTTWTTKESGKGRPWSSICRPTMLVMSRPWTYSMAMKSESPSRPRS